MTVHHLARSRYTCTTESGDPPNIYADHAAHDLGRTPHHIAADMLAIWEHHLTELLDLVGILNEIRPASCIASRNSPSDRRDMDRLLTNAGNTIVIRAIGDNHPCHVCKVVIIIAQNLLAIALTDTEAGTAAGINSLHHAGAAGGDIHITLGQQFIRGLMLQYSGSMT